MSDLTYSTFISDPLPVAGADRVPNGDERRFSPLTTTLIAGEQSAALVDPPMTIEQTAAVGDWIEASGKQLESIYITHGHGDHWFGSQPLVERFPSTTVYALPGTIAMMHVHGSEQMRNAFWEAQFPGQLPPSPVLAVEPTDGRIVLEGHELLPIVVGHTDTDDTTVLHVPDLGLVVAGDAVYNGVHQYLREAAGDGITEWLAALDQITALQPTAVVAGHKDKTRSDDPATIEETRQYLLDGQRLLADSPTPIQFFERMLELYPRRLNPGALWSSALALLS